MGEFVKQDETVANIETDKVTIPVNSPVAGQLSEVFAKTGDTVQVGSDLFKLDPDKVPSPTDVAKETKKDTTDKTTAKESNKSFSSSSSLFVEAEQPAKQPAKQPAEQPAEQQEKEVKSASTSQLQPLFTAVANTTASAISANAAMARTEHRERMTRMRTRIAERMKESQNSAASLTTFNEIDMSALSDMRSRLKDEFLKKHGVKLGYMSPFVRAAAMVLSELPIVNARLEGQDIIYHDYVDISVAVATHKGLVTPVLRNCHQMSLAQIEQTIAALGERARDNKISIEELTGGTFTISNGGVFGSMMGTPIINVPQSAILGMHAIKERPVVIDAGSGKIEARPMMYVALTYDHRLIDGREAVTFLVRLKQLLEDPTRILLDL